MRALFALSILVMTSLPLGAEEIGTSTSPLIVASTVYFVNPSDSRLTFSIKPDLEDGVWSEYRINAASNKSISCDDCSATFFQFRIRTGDTTVKYRLSQGERYAFFWNEDAGVWDLQLIDANQ